MTADKSRQSQKVSEMAIPEIVSGPSIGEELEDVAMNHEAD
jgi:hypothetical protein